MDDPNGGPLLAPFSMEDRQVHEDIYEEIEEFDPMPDPSANFDDPETLDLETLLDPL